MFHRNTVTLAFISATMLFVAARTHGEENQAGALPEPEYVGVFYYYDSGAHSLKELPVDDYRIHTLVPLTVFSNVRWKIRVPHKSSSFQVESGGKPSFVFQNSEVLNVRLFQFSINDDEREFEKEKGKVNRGFYSNSSLNLTSNPGLPVDVSKFGDAYKITPAAPLEPGEYALTTGERLFTFGIGETKK
jgi:hypothetical protein